MVSRGEGCRRMGKTGKGVWLPVMESVSHKEKRYNTGNIVSGIVRTLNGDRG